MRKTFLAFFALLSLLQLSAQIKEGTISYEKKINIWKRITDEQRRATVPQFRITHYTLLFNDTVSVYQTIKENDGSNSFGGGEGRGNGGFGGGGNGGSGGGGFGGGGRMSRMLGSNDGDLFKNFSTGISIQETEQSGKTFLITDTIHIQPWKITDETKEILGYTCHKATLKQKMGFGGGGNGGGWGGGRRNRDGQGDNANPDTTRRVPREVDVVAWYADKILTPAGPDKFSQLPGAVLEVDIDNGSIIYTATEVKAKVSQKDLKEPKKGKKVTREEYQKILKDLRDHFGSAMPETNQ